MWGQLGLSLVVAIATAVVASELTVRAFHRQQWWQRKADAYTAVFDALHDVRTHCDLVCREMLEKVHFASEYAREVAAKSTAGANSLRKAISTGEFLLSESALKILRDVGNKLDMPADPQEYYPYCSSLLRAIDKAFLRLPAIAKQDLAITRRPIFVKPFVWVWGKIRKSNRSTHSA